MRMLDGVLEVVASMDDVMVMVRTPMPHRMHERFRYVQDGSQEGMTVQHSIADQKS